LRQLNPPTIQLFREQMEDDGIGAPTIRRSMAILQAVCRYAVTRGEIATNPVKEVRKPPARRDLAVTAISPRQIENLREQLEDPASRLLISLLAYEGLRPEEALALEDRHAGKTTLLIEQKVVDGVLVAGQKTGRPPRSRAMGAGQTGSC
jgi:integrase